MVKNKPIYIFLIILIAIVSIAISVVVSSYNKNKVIVPDIAHSNLSKENLLKIKSQYEESGRKQDFLELCEEIELVVANKLLDGSVTNNEQLAHAIVNLNEIFESDDWTNINLEYPAYWMGVWKLDEEGRLTFRFLSEEIKPSWCKDDEVKKYII